MNEEQTKGLIEKLYEKMDSIEKRLFRDNGTLSVQTRLDRHEQVIRGLIWALSVVGGSLLATFVAMVVFAIKTALAAG